MSNPFFDHPILNSPYKRPSRHWELDESGQPTQKIAEQRRGADFITPIPKPKKRKGADQAALVFDEGKGLSTAEQRYDHTAIINAVRQHVDQWRAIPSASDWKVTPETARLLQHWRHHASPPCVRRHPALLLPGGGGGDRDLAHGSGAAIRQGRGRVSAAPRRCQPGGQP